MPDLSGLDPSSVDTTLSQIEEWLFDLDVEGQGEASSGGLGGVDAACHSDGLLNAARVPYRVVEHIAPIRGEDLPAAGDFVAVMCHNLSTGGIGFLLPSRPDFESLVVALGKPPSVSYMEARVVHSTEVLVLPSGRVQQPGGAEAADRRSAGEPMFLVGCQFVRRIAALQDE
jgi:hypothetical protein